MADRPILFSAPMIRALLDGRKTQTRRLFKGLEPQTNGNWHIFGGMLNVSDEDVPMHAPDYVRIQSGDRLYVREHWRTNAGYDPTPPRELGSDDCMVRYEADGTWTDRGEMTKAGKHRQAMHMPRWASRLTLTVTGVKVERLQDISEEDAKAEGIEDGGCLNCGNSSFPSPCGCEKPEPNFADSYSTFGTASTAPALLRSIRG